MIARLVLELVLTFVSIEHQKKSRSLDFGPLDLMIKSLVMENEN